MPPSFAEFVPKTPQIRVFGSPGSMTKSVIERSVLNVLTVSLVKVGETPAALVERNRPRLGKDEATSQPIPPIPLVVETKIVLGSVGWTTILPIERPLITSTAPPS